MSTLLILRIGADSPLPGEVLARTAPNLADLGVAIFASAAGAYVTVRTEAGSALPGVGIAVALVPPLATVGITLGADRGELACGALLLFLTNLAAIALAAGLMFAVAGFVPSPERLRRRTVSLAFAAALVIALLAPLSQNGLTKAQSSSFTVDATRVAQRWAPTLEVDEIVVDPTQDPKRIKIRMTGAELRKDPAELAPDLVDEFDEPLELEFIFLPRVRIVEEP